MTQPRRRLWTAGHKRRDHRVLATIALLIDPRWLLWRRDQPGLINDSRETCNVVEHGRVPDSDSVRRRRPPSRSETARHARLHTALALLATLAVKGRAPMTGYDRAEFGAAWTDTNRNGCDTRNDVLRRDLTRREIKAGTNNCVALGGWLEPDPYTGQPDPLRLRRTRRRSTSTTSSRSATRGRPALSDGCRSSGSRWRTTR